MKRVLLMVNAVGLLVGISYGMHGPILPVFAKDVIGASYTDLGLIGLATFIPYMFIPLFVGVLLNRYNNAHMLSLSVVINSTSLYLLSVAQTVPEIMALRVMTGISHSFFWPPCESIISKVSSGRERVRHLARFTGFFVAGFTIGPLLGSIILEGMGESYRTVFEFSAFIAAAAIVGSLWLRRGDVRSSGIRLSFSSIREIARFPMIVSVLIYCTATFGIILTIYPAFLSDKSITGSQIEILYFVMGAARIAALTVTGRLARRAGPTVTASILAIMAGFAVSFVTDDAAGFAVAMLLMGFGFSVVFPLTLEIILSRTRKEIAGTMIGTYETTFGIGWTVGPVSAGLISQFSTTAMPYLVFFIVGVVVVALTIIRRRVLKPQHVQDP